jgi:hypothetical protein
MEETLSMDNILDQSEIDNLFSIDENPNENDKQEQVEKTNENTTETIEVDNLFNESESVGSEDVNENMEGTESNKSFSTSSDNRFYSSIAKALKEEGIFHTLEDDQIDKIVTPEDLAEAINDQIKSMFDARSKRVDEALNLGVEPSRVRQYEQVINYLESIEDSAINDESEKGETLRKQLIYQDFINRGYSKERAEREVKKSFDSGSDIDDAKEALTSNIDYYQSEYDSIVNEAKEIKKEEEARLKDQAAKLKKSILEESTVFGDIPVDKLARHKIFENISKPVYKDPDTGELYTAIQKYEKDNRLDFLKYVGLFYTLTDGFTNIDALVKNKVNKEVKKGLRNLERNIVNNSSRASDGSLRFTSGVSDPESSLSGWQIDI